MRPTTSRTTILVGLATIAALTAFFVASIQRGVQPETGFTPPVYANGDSPTELILPLYLAAPASGAPKNFSAEDAERIVAFKKKIVARVSSGAPLAKEEKTVLAVSIATTAKSAVGALIIADQTILRFTPPEIALIENALQK